jgi:hypothetical protein
LAQGIKRLNLFRLTPILDINTALALLDMVLAFVDHVVGDAELTHQSGRGSAQFVRGPATTV